MSIKKGDTVMVISGKFRSTQNSGKQYKGVVKELLPEKNRVVVEGLNLIKRHMKPGRTRARQAGIIEMEGSLPMSSLMLICTKCDKPTRVGVEITENGKSRICKKCGASIDRA